MKPNLAKKNSNFTQGIFCIKNKNKYKGKLPCIYRSGLELKAMRWFDNNPNILSWGSESVVIPYLSPLDGRLHRYFVDFVLSLKDKNGAITKYLIEVKPEKQTMPPIESKRKKASTMLYENAQYVVNRAKWDAAEQYCKKNNLRFLVLTEKHIT